MYLFFQFFFLNPLNMYIEGDNTAQSRTHIAGCTALQERRPHQTHIFDTSIYRSLVWHGVARLSLTGAERDRWGRCVLFVSSCLSAFVCNSALIIIFLFVSC